MNSLISTFVKYYKISFYKKFVNKPLFIICFQGYIQVRNYYCFTCIFPKKKELFKRVKTCHKNRKVIITIKIQGHEENIKCNNLRFVDNDKYLQEKRRLHSCMVICQKYKLACQLFSFAPNLTWPSTWFMFLWNSCISIVFITIML